MDLSSSADQAGWQAIKPDFGRFADRDACLPQGSGYRNSMYGNVGRPECRPGMVGIVRHGVGESLCTFEPGSGLVPVMPSACNN
jgi:hypothetical protein